MATKGIRRAALLAVLLASPALHAAEVAGVAVADQLKVAGGDLVLNGAGLRSKVFFKVYVGALYVSQKSAAAEAVIDSGQPRRMRLHMLRDLDADSFYAALDEGLRNNHSAAQLAELKPQSDQLAALMRGFGKVRESEVIDIDFTGDGIVLARNGSIAGKVAGAAIGRALLRVWLGEKPADAGLKKALLGS